MDTCLVVVLSCFVFWADFTLMLQIDSHMKRLDEDLNNFAEDLKQGSNFVLVIWMGGFVKFLSLDSWHEQSYFFGRYSFCVIQNEKKTIKNLHHSAWPSVYCLLGYVILVAVYPLEMFIEQSSRFAVHSEVSTLFVLSTSNHLLFQNKHVSLTSMIL